MAWTDPRTWVTDELVTAAMMNAHVRDNFNSVIHLVARKSSNQSVTSSTTLANDTALVFPMAANEVWRFEFHLIYAADTAGDLKVAFTFPALGEIVAGAAHRDAAATMDLYTFSGTTTPTTSQSFVGGGGATKISLPITGVFINAGTAGDLTLQWAQNTSHGTATTVYANSTVWGCQLA